MARVIGYIDGFNLYFGLKARGLRQFYWIDPHRLVKVLLSPEYQLAGVKYFTARVRGPQDKRERQTAYLDAINAVSDAEVIHGKFYRKNVKCHACNTQWRTHEEKMTDSAISAHIVADAFMDVFDTAILVGGDTDIVPAVKMVKRHFPTKEVVTWFPPARKNQAVADVCHDYGQITGEHLRKCLMPEHILIDGGPVEIKCPHGWSPI